MRLTKNYCKLMCAIVSNGSKNIQNVSNMGDIVIFRNLEKIWFLYVFTVGDDLPETSVFHGKHTLPAKVNPLNPIGARMSRREFKKIHKKSGLHRKKNSTDFYF